MFGQVHAQGGEVGFPESGLLRIKTFEQSLHLPRLLGSRDKGIEMFVKRIATYERTSEALMA